jgi:GNAT superfamily N-acetyltransferase
LSDVVVRPVAPGDAKDLQRNCFPRSTLDEVQRLIETSLKGALEGRYMHLVAEDDGAIVGTIELAAQSGRAKHRGELFRFVVAESHRGKGIARMLLEAALAEAKRMGIEMIDAAARAGTSAEDAYRKLGFVEFGRLPGGLVMDPEEVYDLVYFYLPVEEARAAGP